MAPRMSCDSGYETGNADGDDDFYAHNHPPSTSPSPFPTPPRERQLREQAVAAEELRQRLLEESRRAAAKANNKTNITYGNGGVPAADPEDDDYDHVQFDTDDGTTARPLRNRARTFSQVSSYDVIADDEVEAARQKEKVELEVARERERIAREKKHDDEYFARVTDASVTGFSAHVVKMGFAALKSRCQPLVEAVEEYVASKPVGTPEKLQCPCWNYPDYGWRYCFIHEEENAKKWKEERRWRDETMGGEPEEK